MLLKLVLIYLVVWLTIILQVVFPNALVLFRVCVLCRFWRTNYELYVRHA